MPYFHTKSSTPSNVHEIQHKLDFGVSPFFLMPDDAHLSWVLTGCMARSRKSSKDMQLTASQVNYLNGLGIFINRTEWLQLRRERWPTWRTTLPKFDAMWVVVPINGVGTMESTGTRSPDQSQWRHQMAGYLVYRPSNGRHGRCAA